MRIGIISDTHVPHGLDSLGPEPAQFFSSVDLIIHTGDVDTVHVLDWLEQFAPVVCARGNHDVFDDPRMRDVVLFEHEGWRLGAKHQVDDRLEIPDSVRQMKQNGFPGVDVDILIGGDTHFERVEYVDGTLLLNSGSALMPHNYSLRLGSVALLELTRERVHAEIISLGESRGLRNPTRVGHIAFSRNGVLTASFDGAPIEAHDGEVRWPDDV